ncbi:putative lysozyme [Aeromonas phage LAh_8]|uniref:Lysozyme n=1 Tax=Aeromonas phage LAh_8 TaxID=2591032 RepID=A0A514A0L5_9CAUD|nr:putative lysozyme [Aeromonas phage LAh_8]QDH46775.1 putative lysozyme [Aeromonas phage LAh_8]
MKRILMTSIVNLIELEEGWREKPYFCTEGYPTIGFGFKIGPKGAPLSNYQFKISKAVGAVWLNELVDEFVKDMEKYQHIDDALKACNDARKAVLISMAYQMGVDGLAAFKNTLRAVAESRWTDAKAGMLNSKWAKQTPERANRHANQMLTGEWDKVYL